MRNVCYTAVSRDNFIRLYRYGNIKIIKNFIFSDNENLRDNLVNLLQDMQCEHDEDYVILRFLSDPSPQTYNNILYALKIQNVQHIYVLSQQALGYYKPKFNPRIQFMIDPYTVLGEVNEYNELYDMEKGVDVFIEQFDFIDREQIEEELQLDFKKKLLEMNDSLSSEFESFYLDLIFYKRKSFFPDNDIGFIYDLMIIATLKKRKENTIKNHHQGQLKLDSSPTYNKVKNERRESLYEYINFLENNEDEDIKNFIKSIGHKELIVGAIFLKIYKLLLDKNNNFYKDIQNVVDVFSNDYRNEVSISLYLIGLLFGYKELYNDYYDFLNLDIYNSQNINTSTKPATDELKSKISDLEKELEKYKKENNLTTQSIDIDDDSLGQKVENNEDMSVGEQQEYQITTMPTPTEDNSTPDNSLPNEEIDLIKDFLSYLDKEMLVDIWMNASGAKKKDLENITKEELVENIKKHESSCSTVKELLQTFQQHTLAFVLYKLLLRDNTKGKNLKELKLLEKEDLISNLEVRYNHYSKKDASNGN